jgi:hypothetical protein
MESHRICNTSKSYNLHDNCSAFTKSESKSSKTKSSGEYPQLTGTKSAQRKAFLGTRHEGTSEERMYRSYSFLTSAQDGMTGQPYAPAAINPDEGPPVPTGQEVKWAPGPVWKQWLEFL